VTIKEFKEFVDQFCEAAEEVLAFQMDVKGADGEVKRLFRPTD